MKGRTKMHDLILETIGLSKRFGKQLAVDEVSLQIKRNSVYGLLGPNGAGKTTTLKMIVGLLRPTNGKIIFDGEPWQRKHLAKIGSLIEAPARLRKRQVFFFHNKCINIATCFASKTVKHLFFRSNCKRRGFFVMKRAFSYKIFARLF